MRYQSRLSVGANFWWTLAGNVVYAASQWGMLVVLAKVGSPAVVGTFSLALAICAPVMMLSGLNLRAVQATDAVGQFPFRSYLGARVAGIAVALVVIAGIAVGANRDRGVATAVLLMGAAKAVELLSDVLFGLFQQRERMDIIAISMMIKGPTGLGLLVLAMAMTGSLAAGICALIVSGVALLALYELPRARRLLGLPGASGGSGKERLLSLRSGMDATPYARLIWLALPLGVVMGLASLEPNLPRYVLQHYLGLSSVGIYSSMAYLMIAGNTIVGALGQAASPRLAQHYASGDRSNFVRLLGRLLMVSFVVGGVGVALAVVAGRELLTVLYTREYAGHPGAFVLLMIAALFVYLFGCLGVAVTAMRVFRIQAPIHGVLVLLVLGLSTLLVRSRGLEGAAWAMVISMALGTGMYALVAAMGLRDSLLHPRGDEATTASA